MKSVLPSKVPLEFSPSLWRRTNTKNKNQTQTVDTFEDTRCILEPAGALALAGCKRYMQETGSKNMNFVCLASGANMNFNRLRFVAERAEIGEEREALFSVVIPERPGSFQDLYSVIHPRNVTEFSYRYSSAERAVVFVALEVKSRDDVAQLTAGFIEKGLEALDLTANEMAKSHARYLVGGRSNVSFFLLSSFLLSSFFCIFFDSFRFLSGRWKMRGSFALSSLRDQEL